MPFGQQIFPLRGTWVCGGVRFPRLRPFGGGTVGHIGGVVFVCQAREVVAEFVDENVGSERVVGGDGGEEVEDAAAPVLAIVDHDFDELVRRGRRRFAQPFVIEGQDVALRPEGVICRAQGRAAEDAIGGARHAAFLGRRIHGPHVEILAVLLERRRGEQRLRHTAGVAVPLVHFGCCVAVAHQQEVHLVARSAVLHHRPRVQFGWRAAIHRGIGRIHHDGPDLAKLISRTALLDHHLNRGSRVRGSGRFRKRRGAAASPRR